MIDHSSLNAEMNLGDDNGFWSILGTKCNAENQKFKTYKTLYSEDVVSLLTVVFVEAAV